MVVTSIKLTEQERNEWQSLADFDGITLNQMIREAVQERYEDFLDTQAMNRALLDDDGQRFSIDQVRKELNL